MLLTSLLYPVAREVRPIACCLNTLPCDDNAELVGGYRALLIAQWTVWPEVMQKPGNLFA